MSADNEKEDKAAFAAFLFAEPAEPFKAGLAVFPSDTRQALWVATHWLNDAEVLAEMKRLRDAGADMDALPTKADAARAAWDLTKTGPFEDRIKALKLYSDIRGFIDKPNTGVQVNVTRNKVMIVRDHGTNEEWENRLKQQQRDLVNGNHTAH